jgi:hypothetical protein
MEIEDEDTFIEEVDEFLANATHASFYGPERFIQLLEESLKEFKELYDID